MKTPATIFIEDEQYHTDAYNVWKDRKSATYNTEYIRRDVVRHCVKELVYGYRGDCPDDESADGMIDGLMKTFNKLKEGVNEDAKRVF